MVEIACIVEGHGEAGAPGGTGAAEILVRRIAREIDQELFVSVPVVLRIPKGSLSKRGGIEAAVERAARKLGGRGAVLVLMDSDDDVRETLEGDLLRRAQQTRGDLPIAVVAARREFEAWFLAAAASLAGCEGLAQDLQPPPDPEAIPGAKEWLGKRMAGGRYVETLHQAALTRRFDLQVARTAPSFEHCFTEVARLIGEQRQTPESGAEGSG